MFEGARRWFAGESDAVPDAAPDEAPDEVSDEDTAREDHAAVPPREEALARVIRVERIGEHARLTIDGVEFPWILDADGVSVSVSRSKFPTVTLTLVAERTEVLDDCPPTHVGSGRFPPDE